MTLKSVKDDYISGHFAGNHCACTLEPAMNSRLVRHPITLISHLFSLLGGIFTTHPVILSVGVSMLQLPKLHWTSLYSPPPSLRTSDLRTHLAFDIWWPSLETCSNLFTWGAPFSHRETSCGGYRSMYGQYKRVVYILKCFLLIFGDDWLCFTFL